MAKDIDSGGHVWYRCPPGCDRPGCPFCEGHLALCSTCGAAEGELLSYCPGYRLNADAQEACFGGNVFDFMKLKRMREHSPSLFRETLVRMNTSLRRSQISSEELR